MSTSFTWFFSACYQKASQWLKTLDQKIAYKTEPWKFESEVEKHGGTSLQKYVSKIKIIVIIE